MIFIIGGAYQGKLALAKEKFGVGDGDVFTCSGSEIDFSRRCIDRLEEFTLACVQTGADPLLYLADRLPEWKDSILICQDVSCGVVPMDPQLREWRNATGRLCQFLAAHADQVIRVFCGLEQRIK